MKRSSLILTLILGILPVAGLIIWFALENGLKTILTEQTPPASSSQVTNTTIIQSTNDRDLALASNGHLVLQSVPARKNPTNGSTIIHHLEAGVIITTKALSNWLPVKYNGQTLWVESKLVEPFSSRKQLEALRTMLIKRGDPSALKAVTRLAQAMSGRDRQAMILLLANPIIFEPAKGRPLNLSPDDLMELADDTRILWMPNDRALTLRILSRRAASLLRYPIILLTNCTASNASAMRFGLMQEAGRWLVERIYLDNTHPLLMD